MADVQSTRSDYYVYVLCRENGVPFYIGKGKGQRWADHEWEARYGIRSHKCAIIREMQTRGVDVIKVKLHEGLTETVAHAYEVALIAAVGRGKRGPLVNLTDGGEGTSGLKMQTESVTKRAAARRGTKRSVDAIAKTAAKHVGMKRSPIARANMAAAKFGTIPSPLATLAAAAVVRGTKFTLEHREKIAEALRGKEKSPEHREKLAAANRGKKASTAARANMSAAHYARQARLRAEAVDLAS